MKIRMMKFKILTIFSLITISFGQSDFFLKDLNPNSASYDELIGPQTFSEGVCVIYFGHEY